MNLLIKLFFLFLLFAPLLFILSKKYKIITSYAIHLILSLTSIGMVILYCQQGKIEYYLADLFLLGSIHLRVDELSAIFIVIINLVMLSGVFYSIRFFQTKDNTELLIRQLCTLATMHAVLLSACLIQEILVFIMLGEIAGLCFFVQFFFTENTLKTMLNYLVQLYLSLLLSIIALIWLNNRTGMENFESFSFYFANYTNAPLVALFLVAFVLKMIDAPKLIGVPSLLSIGITTALSLYGMLRILLYTEKNWMVILFLLLLPVLLSVLRWVKIKTTEKIFQSFTTRQYEEKQIPPLRTFLFLSVLLLLSVFGIVKTYLL
ncbi:MAG TPA: hypothetical protein VNB90_06510 [Cytophagaceae bacterium]|nr:hypothetical protein [Cytophagaceae bacterium]